LDFDIICQKFKKNFISSIITDGASSAPETAASVADIGSSLSNFGQQAGGGLGLLSGLGGLGGFGGNQQFLNPSGSQFGNNQQLLNGAQFGGNQQFLNPSGFLAAINNF
jgi:hypothetical protein